MLLLIPLVPFLGYLVNMTMGRRLSKGASGGIATGAMAVAFGLSVSAVYALLQHVPLGGVRSIDQSVFTWIESGSLGVPLAFRLDPLSALMILVVTGIGTLIHLYSTAYMQTEREGEFARYFAYLNLFAAFMLLLVLAANLPVMFVGWEGVGLCSYLLVGFWFTKPSAADAGKKAFVVNRVGDFGFVLAMFWIFKLFGTLNFQEIAVRVSPLAPEITFGALTGITLLLFLGATGKSAQIPLYVWLPDAMEGPTPVSALIHAATMVTAGVYLIGRNAVLFSHAPHTMHVVAVIGCVTALMAGTIALVQNDIKRVLAYSTVSQLGYMFLAMGVGAFGGGIFHLYTHAFFKALLFLGAGAVIHALDGEQDLRRMGGLRSALPVTYWTFLIGALAISGVPLLSGFFSKDEILWQTFAHGHIWLWATALLTSFLTAAYMFRLVYLAFFGASRARATAPDADHAGRTAGSETEHAPHGHLHDAPPVMAIALVVLAIGLGFGAGYVGVPNALVSGGNRIETFLAPSFRAPHVELENAPAENGATEGGSPSTEAALMALSALVSLGGIAVATMIWWRRSSVADRMAEQFRGVYKLLVGKYFVDEIYDAVIVQPIKKISSVVLWRGIDVGLLDGTVNSVGLSIRVWSGALRRLQTGSVRAYAMSFFVSVVAILGYYLWR